MMQLLQSIKTALQSRLYFFIIFPSHHWILSGFTDSHPFELVKLPVDQLEYRDLRLFIIDHKKTLAY